MRVTVARLRRSTPSLDFFLTTRAVVVAQDVRPNALGDPRADRRARMRYNRRRQSLDRYATEIVYTFAGAFRWSVPTEGRARIRSALELEVHSRVEAAHKPYDSF
jgi:hypothetical protein